MKRFWPSYHPAVLLKIYVYGYLNQVQSSRRLEREAQRNVELMWLAAIDHASKRRGQGRNGGARLIDSLNQATRSNADCSASS
jgi:transposase